MRKRFISKELEQFIREQIQTVFRLEVLLLLHRAQSKVFTPAEIAHELGFEREIAEEQLLALATNGLVVQSPSEEPAYSYQPANPVLGSMVDKLALGYSKQRVPILSVILAKRPDRIRVFAEAFKLIRGND